MTPQHKNRKTSRIGKPVNLEFWNYLNQEREFVVRSLYRRNSDLTIEDCEDIVGEFIEFYARQSHDLGEDARRFEALNRTNLISRVEWKKKDFLIRRNAQRRGAGVPHTSIDQQGYCDWDLNFSVPPAEAGISQTAEILLEALSEAGDSCEGKKLAVVNAMQRWLRGGCRSESWYEELSASEVKEFMALKKGKSLEGKASATFSKVKRVLREIILAQGLRQN